MVSGLDMADSGKGEASGMAHYGSEHLGVLISDLLHKEEAYFGCLMNPMIEKVIYY